jgi:hypothetical protein
MCQSIPFGGDTFSTPSVHFSTRTFGVRILNSTAHAWTLGVHETHKTGSDFEQINLGADYDRTLFVGYIGFLKVAH